MHQQSSATRDDKPFIQKERIDYTVKARATSPEKSRIPSAKTSLADAEEFVCPV